MILQSVVRVMAGKMPAAEEQSSKTQAANQRVYGLFHVFNYDNGLCLDI